MHSTLCDRYFGSVAIGLNQHQAMVLLAAIYWYKKHVNSKADIEELKMGLMYYYDKMQKNADKYDYLVDLDSPHTDPGSMRFSISIKVRELKELHRILTFYENALENFVRKHFAVGRNNGYFHALDVVRDMLRFMKRSDTNPEIFYDMRRKA